MSIERKGTVSHGTNRPEDLIPTFIAEVDAVLEELSLTEPNPNLFAEIDNKLSDIEVAMEATGYFESEHASWDLEYLFDTLNSFAPEGKYFGAHGGDASDFGWWEVTND